MWVFDEYTVVHDDKKEVKRVIGSIINITERKQAELDARFLADLAQHFTHINDPLELLDVATRAIALHMGVSRCLLFEIDFVADQGLVRRDYHAEGLTSLAGTQNLSGYNPEDKADFLAGRILSREDVKTHPRTAALYERGYAPLGIRATMAIPLMREGQRVASLWVSHHEPRQWSGAEEALLHTVAERMWLAFENVRLHEVTLSLNANLETRVAERTMALHESQTQLRRLSAYSERMREDECTRIAREVHDELGSSLTGLKMTLARAGKGRADDDELMIKIHDMNGQIDGLVQTVRRIASDLRPPLLDDFGLLAALEWEAHEWEKRTGLSCQFNTKLHEINLDRPRCTVVFRVFRVCPKITWSVYDQWCNRFDGVIPSWKNAVGLQID